MPNGRAWGEHGWNCVKIPWIDFYTVEFGPTSSLPSQTNSTAPRTGFHLDSNWLVREARIVSHDAFLHCSTEKNNIYGNNRQLGIQIHEKYIHVFIYLLKRQ